MGNEPPNNNFDQNPTPVNGSSLSQAAKFETTSQPEQGYVPTPQLPSVQPAKQDTPKENSEKKPHTWVYLIILVIFLLPLVSITLIYFLILRPRVVLGSAISKLFNTNYAVQFVVEDFDNDISNLIYNFEKTESATKGEFSYTTNDQSGSKPVKTTIKTLSNADYFYVKPQKENSTQTLNQLLTNFPELNGIKVFGTAQPILFGDSWLRFNNNKSTQNSNPPGFVYTILGTAITAPFEINNFQSNYKEGGVNYKKYVLGLNKEFFANYISATTANEFNFTESDKKNLLETINNTDKLNQNILEVLIDNRGYLSKVTINVPKLDGMTKDVTYEQLQQGQISTFSYIYNKLLRFANNNSSEYTKIVDVKFDKYKEDFNIVPPVQYVDYDSLDLGEQQILDSIIYFVLFDANLEAQSNNTSNIFSNKTHETKLLFDKGDYQNMLSSANDLPNFAENDEERAISYYWIGLAYYKLNNLSEAEKNLTKATETNPEYSAPYVTLAAISYQQGSFQKGLDQSLKCAQIDPDYAWCYNNIGLGYLFLGNKNRGIENLQKAVSLDPLSFIFQDNLNRAKNSQ